MGRSTWPTDPDALDREQERLAGLDPPPWLFPPGAPAAGLHVGGCFLAYAAGEQGPGAAGDRGWAGAAVVACPGLEVVEHVAVPCAAGARYERGRLALREGPGLAAAVDALLHRPDVLLVDATGRDHPRGAGLALHLGAVLDLPTVGVTNNVLLATGEWPGPARGDRAPLHLGGRVVGTWLRTRAHVRPLAVHAAWRTDADTAVAVVLAATGRVRAPEPLRAARTAARRARARGRAQGRGPGRPMT